jgi:hypothetical protein
VGREGIGSWRELNADTVGLAVTGTLKGYDALMNLVLDDVDEVVRGMCSPPVLPLFCKN